MTNESSGTASTFASPRQLRTTFVFTQGSGTQAKLFPFFLLIFYVRYFPLERLHFSFCRFGALSVQRTTEALSPGPCTPPPPGVPMPKPPRRSDASFLRILFFYGGMFRSSSIFPIRLRKDGCSLGRNPHAPQAARTRRKRPETSTRRKRPALSCEQPFTSHAAHATSGPALSSAP